MGSTAEEYIDWEAEAKKQAEPKTQFFRGEARIDLMLCEETPTLVAYAASLEATLEEIKDQLEKCREEIKKREHVDQLTAKAVREYGDHQVILTPREGSVTFDARAYVISTMTKAAWDELEETKRLVKDGKATSPFFKVGKSSVALEIIRKT